MEKNYEEVIKYGNDELFEKGNLDVVAEIFSTNYVVHSSGKDYKGHNFIKQIIGQIRSAISDIRVVAVEFYMQSGNTIGWQRTLSGMHKADMMGIPPTGHKVVWIEMMISRFDSGKIAEEWMVSELAGELLSKSPREG